MSIDCGFRRNISTLDPTLCTVKHFRIKWEYNEVLLQLFIDFEKAFD